MLTNFFKKVGGSRAGQLPPAVPTDDATIVLPLDAPAPAPVGPQNWLPGDIIDEHYRVDRIFSGAMGKVYIAEHLAWGVWMAIKAPKPEVWADKEGIKRILREANGWIRLGVHPNIASCYFVKAISKIPHIFIEFVAGGTLEDWINRGLCREMRTSLSLAIQFCNGMEYTHSKGIIHRDIKPQNILISKDSLVKITDFGILRSIKNPAQEKKSTLPAPKSKDDTVGFRGTPNYASPEQLRDTHRVDRRTDIFSFGLCLWMMFCGKRPYKHNSQGECPDPEPTDSDTVLPQALKKILVKCVAYHQDERYNDFTELKAALNAVYVDLFKVPCPYSIMEEIDLRAENLNNRAVSLAELGKIKQAEEYLSRTLDINDNLSEALYNQIMLKWRKGLEKPERLLGRIEACKKRFPRLSLFDDAEKEVTDYLDRTEAGEKVVRKKKLQLHFCFPKSPMELYRESQLRKSVHHNILALMQKRQLTECYDILIVSWGNESFKKDKFYYKIYEQLIPEGEKHSLYVVQRLFTHPAEDDEPVRFMASFPERKLIFLSSGDKKVFVRSLGTRKKKMPFAEMQSRITSLAACPVAGLIAVGMENGTVAVSPLKSAGQKILPGGDGAVHGLDFSSDGRQLYAGRTDGTVTCYDLAGTAHKNTEVAEGVRVLLSLGNDDFAAGCEDGSVRLCNSSTGEISRQLEAHVLSVAAMSLSRDGRKIATASADRLVRIWDRNTGQCLQTIDGHEDSVTSVMFLPDGLTVLAGCADDIIKVWDWQKRECLQILDARGDGVTSFAPGGSGHTFLAGRRDGAIVLWMVIYQLEFDDGRPSALRRS